MPCQRVSQIILSFFQGGGAALFPGPAPPGRSLGKRPPCLRAIICFNSRKSRFVRLIRFRMKQLRLVALFFLLPFCAQSNELYHIQRPSERALTQTYASLLLDACHHADQFWQDLPGDPPVGCWGTGRSDQMNEGIRAISGMVLASGALLKYSDALTDSERQHCRERATQAIRYAVSSHITGTRKCTDGKPWGGSWQSAMWTATLTFGARLFWDELDPELQQGVERVVASEADRFLKVKPPAATPGDTKAEENG